MACPRLLPLLALALPLASCSKPEPPPERTEPWPAPQAHSAPENLVVRCSLTKPSEVVVTMRAREGKLSGVIRVLTGELEVDLLDLSRTRGKIRIDVGSIRMGDPGESSEARQQTTEALNWLDLGSNQPPAKRERDRWAEFVIVEIEDLSAPAAHEGRRVKRSRRPPPADGGDDVSPTDATGEVREVTLLARGRLTFHAYRVEHAVRLRARFHYPAEPTPGAKPTRLVIETRSPVKVSLAAHDVKPRDGAGVFMASGVKLWGVKVAREARVSLRLTAQPRS